MKRKKLIIKKKLARLSHEKNEMRDNYNLLFGLIVIISYLESPGSQSLLLLK